MITSRSKMIMLGLLVFIASFIVRLLFFIYILDGGSKSWLLVDSEQYHQLALSFLHNNYQHTLSFLRLPGYPAFLAACYACMGIAPAGALVIQILLASSIPLLIYWLSITLFPHRHTAAWYAMIYSCIQLGLVLYAGMLSTESLFLIFLLLFFIFFFKALQHEDQRLFLLAGSILGIGSLIRPVGHYLLVLSCCIILVFHKNIRSVISLNVGWISIAGLWLLRNVILTGHLFFHTLPGQHFLQYSAAYVYQDAHNVSYIDARRTLIQQYDNKCSSKALSEIERCFVAEKIAYTTLMQHPLLSLKHAIIHMVKTCIAPHSQLLFYLVHDWHQTPTHGIQLIKKFVWPADMPWHMIVIIYYDLVTHLILLLAAGWFLITRKKQYTYQQITILLFMLLFIGITFAYGSARLRLPIEPLLILCATGVL